MTERFVTFETWEASGDTWGDTCDVLLDGESVGLLCNPKKGKYFLILKHIGKGPAAKPAKPIHIQATWSAEAKEAARKEVYRVFDPPSQDSD